MLSVGSRGSVEPTVFRVPKQYQPQAQPALSTTGAPQPTQVAQARKAVSSGSVMSPLTPGLAAPIIPTPPPVQEVDTIGEALADLPRIAQLIREDTGWSLDTSKIRIDVGDRETFFKEAMEDARVRAGISREDWARMNTPSNFVEKMQAKINEYATKRAVLAVYLPSQDRVIIVRENTKGANVNGVKEVLYHELIHGAQDQNQAAYVDAVNKTVGESVRALLQHGADSDEYLDLNDTLNARMALLEGHPTYLQNKHKANHFPDSKMGMGVGAILGSLVQMVSKQGRMKVAQYLKGQEVLDKLTKEDPNFIEELYAKPQLVDVLLKSRGTVRIEVAADTPDSELESLRVELERLKSINPNETKPEIILERAAQVRAAA